MCVELCNTFNIGKQFFNFHVQLHLHFSANLCFAGQQYNKDGIFTPWWTNNSVKNFIQKQGCFESQYSKYEIFGYNVSGVFLNYHNQITCTLCVSLQDHGGPLILCMYNIM